MNKLNARTEWMYKTLREVDKFKNYWNKFEFDIKTTLKLLDFLTNLINELIEWLKQEINFIKEDKRPRQDSDPANELTNEINNLIGLHASPLWYIKEELENNKNKEEFKNLLNHLKQLNKLNDKHIDLNNKYVIWGNIDANEDTNN